MPILTKRATNATPLSGLWASISNAYDTGNLTFATWTSVEPNEVGAVNLLNYDFSTIPNNASLNSITCTVGHNETTPGRFANATVAFYIDNEQISNKVLLSLSGATANTSTVTIPLLNILNITVDKIKNPGFKVIFEAIRYNGTTSSTAYLDYVDINVNYNETQEEWGVVRL